jgi:hypothetical protein
MLPFTKQQINLFYLCQEVPIITYISINLLRPINVISGHLSLFNQWIAPDLDLFDATSASAYLFIFIWDCTTMLWRYETILAIDLVFNSMKDTEHRLSMEGFWERPVWGTFIPCCRSFWSLDDSWVTHVEQHEILPIAIREVGHAIEGSLAYSASHS